MSPRYKAQAAFISAVGLLLLSGLAGYLTIDRLMQSAQWVVHTYEVRTALGEIDSAVLRSGRTRSAYAISNNHELLGELEDSIEDIPRKAQRLRELTRDNPAQQQLCSQLEVQLDGRIAFLRESIRLEKESPGDDGAQAAISRRTLPLLFAMNSIMQEMRIGEEQMLEVRERATHRLFVLTIVTLCIAFILALALLVIHYRLLSFELNAREQAERNARDSEESLRRLTGRLLQIQDAERRKFSRELHDSLGQYLVGVKMNLEMYAAQRKETLLEEAIRLLDQSVAETRTISHLLHPPLLDEVGFSSAAKWYLEGFAQRSGIALKIDLPDDVSHLPKAVSLGLFRVLQEGLTNIHRHAESSKADITLTTYSERVVLTIRDYGKGIAPELLSSFYTKGTKTGVGLAGMRERIRELGGQINIERCGPGTVIAVSIPVPVHAEATSTAAD